MTKTIKEEILKDWKENYIEYTDQGVLVKYIGDNDIDIDDFLSQAIDRVEEETRKEKIPFCQKIFDISDEIIKDCGIKNKMCNSYNQDFKFFNAYCSLKHYNIL